MSRKPSQHWAQVGESTFVAGMWLLCAVHRVLGRLPFRLCLYPVVFYYWATRPLARQSSLLYLQRMQAAHGAIGALPGWRHSLRHFISFADTILDKTLAISGRYPFEGVRYFGLESVEHMLQHGQGCVYVTAHVGCLELCQAIAERQPGMKLNVLVHLKHAERFNRMLHRRNTANGVNLMPVTEITAATAVTLAEKVAQGEFIAITGDRVPVTASKTTRVPFLGHEAAFPVGPYILGALLKCPVYLMGCVREQGGHTVYIDLLTERVDLPRGNRAAALAQYAGIFVRRLEALLVRAPYDWFNFFPFWEQPGASESLDPIAHERPAA